MILPGIDLSMLPDLHQHLVGTFGSDTTPTPGSDQTIVVLATVVYETNMPLSLLGF